LTVAVVGNKTCPIFQQHGLHLLESAAVALIDEIESEFMAHYPADAVMAASKPFQYLQFDRQLTKLSRKAALTLQKHASQPQHHASATVGAHTTLMRRTHVPTAAAPPTGAAGPSPAAPNATYEALKKELQDVHGVMKQNLDDILTRGESLETVSHYSSQLKDGTQTYYKRTVHMNRMRMLQTYGPPAAVLLIVLVWLWWYFF
jgi:vesicle transport protein SEC22